LIEGYLAEFLKVVAGVSYVKVKKTDMDLVESTACDKGVHMHVNVGSPHFKYVCITIWYVHVHTITIVTKTFS